MLDYRGKVETLKILLPLKSKWCESNEVAATEPTADVDLSESMAAIQLQLVKQKQEVILTLLWFN